VNEPSSAAKARGSGLAVIGTVLLTVLMIGVLALNIVVVPGAKRKFDEFGLTLPWITQNVIRVSNWVVENWGMMIPVLVAAGAGNFLLMRQLGQRGSRLPVVWVVAVAALLGAVIAVTLVSIELPMMKLREGLRR
jgi:type II secretory pathway component PulF